MEKISPELEEKLLDYLDGSLRGAEKESLEQQFQQNPVLKARLETLRTLHQLLAGNNLEQPSKNFTQQVMLKLDQYPRTSSLSIRNGLLLLTGVFVVAILAALMVSTGMFDNTTSVIDLNKIEVPKPLEAPQQYVQEYIQQPLPSFEFDGKLMVNIIICLNLVLGWILLDRAILKPLFKKRMQMGH
ncbi:MAG TPA: hypothetical protein VGK59_08515 [Ohtaekwangia sp.]